MARYIEIEEKNKESQKTHQQVLDRYALERKVNRAKPQQLVEWVCDNTLKPTKYLFKSNNYDNWILFESAATICKKSNKFKTIATHIANYAPNFFNSPDNISALKGIHEVYNERIRPIESWTPKRVNYKTVLQDILDHLFTTYKTPKFLITGFIENKMEPMLLFIHLGNGNSMKTFPFIPEMNIPKKALHHLNTTPNHCTYNEAFRRAQIINLGGSDKLFSLLMSTRLGAVTNNSSPKNFKEQDDFWISVIKFFIEHTMMNPDKIPQIIDYIYDQKFTLKRKPGPNNTTINEVDQPNFTMKGRTPMSLVNQSNEWHTFVTLNTKRQKDAKEWEPVDIPDHLETHDHIKFEIVQLTTTNELIKEGNKMHHCVATYASSCIKKWCSIFSFRITNHYQGLYQEPEVTLEIRNNTIVQARGRYNRKPHPDHMRIITTWADKNNIKFSNYYL